MVLIAATWPARVETLRERLESLAENYHDSRIVGKDFQACGYLNKSLPTYCQTSDAQQAGGD
jgi:hypothetical protein